VVTIANSRSDLKAITTRSGVSYDGPQIPPPPSFLPKLVENEQEATKDTDVLGYSDLIMSGNPTPYYDLIVSTTSSTLTPFENSDFLLEEVDAFLAFEDDPTSLEVDQSYLYLKGDILLLKASLNDDPTLPPPNQGNYLLEVRKELKICDAKSNKSSIDEPLEVKLKDLPLYLEYVFLEEDFEPAVQHQRRVNPKIHDVIKQEVLKLLDAGLIYPISNSLWVSPVHYVPKKGGFTIVENEENELILTHLVTGETTFTCPCRTFAYRRMPFGLCNAPGMFQRCMMAIFHDMIEKTMEVFMDDFSVFGNSFQSCLPHLEKMLKSDRGTHFCNDQFAKVMQKFGVTHRLATPYHPLTSGQVEVSNHGLKCILERTVGENQASWSDKLDDALWAFQIAYKTPIRCPPYKLVYGKACHLPIELEHKAYLALKHANFDLQTAGDHRKVQLNELNKLRDQAYENSLIYKDKTKRLHD
nr:reverse transcriptase domain-containing protein [Tanacetum cinerariifolium]